MAIAKDMQRSSKPRRFVPWRGNPKARQRIAKFRRAQAGMTKAEIAEANRKAIADKAERDKAVDEAFRKFAQRWDETIIFGGQPPSRR